MDAFESLVRRHQHRLVGYLRAMLSRPADAEDAAQDTLLRAYRALAQFRGTSTFKTWLYQIATNVARTELAKRRSQPARTGDDDEQALRNLASRDDIEAAFVSRDRLDRALASLPAEMREAVLLRDAEGFGYREIAELTGTPLGTVESRIFRARQRLRDALAPALSGGDAQEESA